ncbi:hypothetical protein [Paracoccus marcusii]|uniref:hypothetical protein n=1 Tax=Paracoccus marcusii TaxID=59779 RepID=UPI00326619D2
MTRFFINAAMAFALSSTSSFATPIHGEGNRAHAGGAPSEHIWLAQGNSGKYKDKPPKRGRGSAGNDNPGNRNAHRGNGNDHAARGNRSAERARGKNGNSAPGPQRFTTAEREEVLNRLLSTAAPTDRDMRRVLAATALAFLTPQLLVANVPGDELITYLNCPPGLAKKDPPCVPPGLAKNGVTYDEWASYDQDRYDTIWVERRDEWLSSQALVDPDPESMLLQSDQIATLFDLDPAPEGQRYALIDGLPVLLDNEDYRSLLLVNQMAEVPDLTAGTPIAPTAALTQDELISLYRLPRLGNDENYAVVNGQLVRLNDPNYELLQMIRVARGVL